MCVLTVFIYFYVCCLPYIVRQINVSVLNHFSWKFLPQVYNADWPFNTVFSAHHGGNKSYLNWKYTQLSQFSPCDTQLLVSGRNDVSVQGGEIVIYNIFAGVFSIQVGFDFFA